MLDEGEDEDEDGRKHHDKGPPAAGSHLREEEREMRVRLQRKRGTLRRAMNKYHSCGVDPRCRAGSGYIPRGRGSIGIKD